MNETISNQIKELQQCMELLIEKVTDKPVIEKCTLKELEILDSKCICLDERQNHIIHGNNGQLNLISDIVINLYHTVNKDIMSLENKVLELENENKKLKYQLNEMIKVKPLTLAELKEFCKETNLKLEFTKPIEIRRRPY